jgi:hypothetical protein
MEENKHTASTPHGAEPLDTKTKPAADPGMLQIFWSMIAAFCGVQNNTNYDRDDAYLETVGFRPYMIAGTVLTFAIIAGLWLIVKLIMY